MIDRGLMPALKSLTESGASGILESTIPPVTAPAALTLKFIIAVLTGVVWLFTTANTKGLGLSGGAGGQLQPMSILKQSSHMDYNLTIFTTWISA